MSPWSLPSLAWWTMAPLGLPLGAAWTPPAQSTSLVNAGQGPFSCTAWHVRKSRSNASKLSVRCMLPGGLPACLSPHFGKANRGGIRSRKSLLHSVQRRPFSPLRLRVRLRIATSLLCLHRRCASLMCWRFSSIGSRNRTRWLAPSRGTLSMPCLECRGRIGEVFTTTTSITTSLALLLRSTGISTSLQAFGLGSEGLLISCIRLDCGLLNRRRLSVPFGDSSRYWRKEPRAPQSIRRVPFDSFSARASSSQKTLR